MGGRGQTPPRPGPAQGAVHCSLEYRQRRVAALPPARIDDDVGGSEGSEGLPALCGGCLYASWRRDSHSGYRGVTEGRRDGVRRTALGRPMQTTTLSRRMFLTTKEVR